MTAKQKISCLGIVVAILLAACASASTPSLVPTQVDVNAIRTHAVGTAMFALTREIVNAATPISSPNPCPSPEKAEKLNFDTSDEGYFLGVMAISEYYTLLNAGLHYLRCDVSWR